MSSTLQTEANAPYRINKVFIFYTDLLNDDHLYVNTGSFIRYESTILAQDKNEREEKSILLFNSVTGHSVPINVINNLEIMTQNNMKRYPLEILQHLPTSSPLPRQVGKYIFNKPHRSWMFKISWARDSFSERATIQNAIPSHPSGTVPGGERTL